MGGEGDFKTMYLMYAIDCCSKHGDTIKSGPVDVRLEIITDGNIPANTTAYCL